MFTLEELKKRCIAERFDNLVQTTGETIEELAARVLKSAEIAISAACAKYNSAYDPTNPIIEEAVYTYAVGLLYANNQLSQGNDEMVRAEKLIESLFFSSPSNPYAESKPGTVAGCRIDIAAECDDFEAFWRCR